jgi:cytochrome oxidase Cu insertion factor (SCO1/SenC/PrrC family)
MNALNDNPPADSNPKAPEKAASEPSPLDERVFMSIVALAVVAMLAVMRFVVWGKGPQEPLHEYRHVGNFQLIERSGRAVTEADLKGKVVVVDFFFGGCSAQCLTLGQQMARLQQWTAGMNDVMLVSITVDPGSDTPQVLSRYANRLQADSNRWLFLTGDKKIIYPLIQQSFLLAVPDDISQPPSSEPTFIHSDKIALVDKRGVVRAYYDGMDSRVAQTVLSGINQVLAEKHTY